MDDSVTGYLRVYPASGDVFFAPLGTDILKPGSKGWLLLEDLDQLRTGFRFIATLPSFNRDDGDASPRRGRDVDTSSD